MDGMLSFADLQFNVSHLADSCNTTVEDIFDKVKIILQAHSILTQLL